MGSFVRHSAAKLRRMEKDQQNPEFRAWLKDMDRELKILFTQDIPDMPADPYTAEGLQHAEAWALRTFWGRVDDVAWPDREERLARFIGQVWVKRLEGEWKYINLTGEGLVPVIQTQFNGSYYAPHEILHSATAERTGDVLAEIYGWAEKKHAEWVEHGRMPGQEWYDFKIARMRRGES